MSSDADSSSSLVVAASFLFFIAGYSLSVVSGDFVFLVIVGDLSSAVSGISFLSAIADGCFLSLIANSNHFSPLVGGLVSLVTGGNSLSVASSLALSLPSTPSRTRHFSLLFSPTPLAPRFAISLTRI